MKSFLILSFALAGSAVAAEGDVNKRLDALEMASYANSLSWSGFLETRYDALTYKSEGVPDEHYNLHRLLAGIDFKSTPSDKLSIFGRVSMGKFFNNDSPGAKTTLSSSRRYAGTDQPSIERFFMNYVPFQSLILTLGRLPTFDGPPHHIYDGSSRLGSYPEQVYTAALDGYALTYSPPIDENHTLSFRFILSPISYITPSAPGTQWKYFEKDTVADGASTVPRKNEVRDATSWMVDYTWAGSSIARSINLVYQGLQLKNLQFTSTLLADITKHVVYLELSDIANVGLTGYVSAFHQKVSTNGGQIVAVNPVTSEPIVFSALANEPDASKTSDATIMGLYYALPVAALNKAALGVEAVQASKYHLNFDFGSGEPFGMYDLRGKGLHVYYTQPLTQGLILRVGMEQAKADYTNGLVGEPMPSKDKMSSIYAHVRADF